MISGEKPALSHTISAGAISISPELFEKVCFLQRIPNEVIGRTQIVADQDLPT